MALAAKAESLKHVPWFSLAEWHQVYNQIYSNDTAEQTKAYETLLVWKARISKLPVGVECTLSIIQVCLRDREWTPKIDRAELPMYYENDLCLMYSTTIMRFLNQISNIGHTKQTSMFQIAKQLKIPEWIVNLRHDAAHGHELPAIGSLRMAANVILTWLHEEYWAAEAKAMEKRLEESIDNTDCEESCETRAFVIFVELWIAVGLYIKANYKSVRDLPDPDLRNMLLNSCTVLPDSPVSKEITIDSPGNCKNSVNYRLIDAQIILFTEITTLMSKNKLRRNIEDILMKTMLESDAFIASTEIIGIFMSDEESDADWNETDLPIGMTNFWQTFISLLNEKKLLEELVWRLLDIVNSTHEDSNRRLVASLWIKSICQALIKLKISQSVAQAMDHSMDDDEQRIGSKKRMLKIREIVNETHPDLSNVMWINISTNVPAFIKDLNFATDILLNANEYTYYFIDSILELISPSLTTKRKDHLLKLVRLQTNRTKTFRRNSSVTGENLTYGIEDLEKICERKDNGRTVIDDKKKSFISQLADQTIRNTKWEKASEDYDWSACAFGVLPWQTESLQALELTITVQPKPAITSDVSTIVPGLVDNKDLTMESRINWDNVLRKKKRLKRKLQSDEHDVMVDRAIEIVKKRQK